MLHQWLALFQNSLLHFSRLNTHTHVYMITPTNVNKIILAPADTQLLLLPLQQSRHICILFPYRVPIYAIKESCKRSSISLKLYEFYDNLI